MKQQNIKLSKIVENKGQIDGLPRNPRQIKDEKYKLLKKSIEDDPEMLELRELLVYPHNNKFVVIGGNMRLKALRELGVAECPCKVIPEETPIEKLRAYTIKDNNSFGDYDYDLLGNDWEVDELLDWGCDLPDITIEEETKEAVEDDYSEEDAQNAESIVKRGEIWQLGEHRLMCGDSTCGGDVALLMNGEKADMVFTDPPYGMSAVSKSGVLKKTYKVDILNDDDNNVAIESFNLVNKLFENIKQVWWGANYYTECLPSSECWIVWDKNNGASDQTDCELAWSNFRSVVRQFTMASEKTNRVHPTQKPVNLIIQILNKFEKKDKFYLILDLFGGSGSTLIACEQLNRKCYMMELDEHYCDVIIDRWQKLTGKTAVKIEQQ